MVKNAFISIKDPNKWNLASVLQELKFENLSETHGRHLKSLRKYLREAKTNGNAQQKQAANIILNNWDVSYSSKGFPFEFIIFYIYVFVIYYFFRLNVDA